MTHAAVRAPSRVIFAGTPRFAVPALRALCDTSRATVVAVYTQPDKPAGRGRTYRMSAVKSHALETHLPIEQPPSWRDSGVVANFARYSPDLLVVAAYGLILPSEILTLPTLGAINVHASLLPRWRGAAPIQRALMAGDAETGITIMRIVPELDAGPTLLFRQTPIAEEDTAGTLAERLSAIGADAIVEVLECLLAGRSNATPQEASGVTYAAKLTREERTLDWTRSASTLARNIRALHPEPLATTDILGFPVNILKACAFNPATNGTPGTVLSITAAGIDIATAEGVLRL
ncbi:MAG: methionyl-tRNA formyltransferase, partial [Gammaproteobacteria bacterium]